MEFKDLGRSNFYVIKRVMALLAAGVLFSLSIASAQTPTFVFTQLDYPNATATYPASINDFGHIVGTYADASGLTHGFLLKGQTYSSIDYPNASQTQVLGINDLGEIVGEYADVNGWHGFFSWLGFFFQIPVDPKFPRAIPYGITNRGEIVGTSGSSSFWQGFVLSKPIHGTYTSITFPTQGGNNGGFAEGINDKGEVVGTFLTPAAGCPEGSLNGYLFDGTNYSTIEFPGSSYTDARGINNKGQIVGIYGNCGANASFLLKGGSYIPITPPLPGHAYASGINNLGTIVGSAGVHGFTAKQTF